MSHACDHAVEYVYLYLDNETSWSHRIRIRWHLRRCDGCGDAFDFEARLKETIRQRCHDEPPPELFDRLRALLHEEAERSRQV